MSSSLETFRGRFINVENTVELIAVVEDLLPLKNDQYKIINVLGSIKTFKASIHCQIESEDGFIKEYQEKTDETLRRGTPKYPKKLSTRGAYITDAIITQGTNPL